MAQYGRHTDEYGNPIRQTDEYGNPIPLTTGAGGGTLGDYGPITGSDTAAATTGTGPYANQYAATAAAPHGPTGTTGAYATDPHGPTGTTGAYGTDPHGPTGTTGAYGTDPYGATGTTGAYGSGGGTATGITDVGLGGGHSTATPLGGGAERPHHEKKGMMEKIKEKLPGHHH